MIETMTFFEGVKDLEKLTGLSDEELWKAGFNLDDMDFGVVCDDTLDFEVDDDLHDRDPKEYRRRVKAYPFYREWLRNRFDRYCVGSNHVEFGDKHYYTIHHS